MKIVYNQDDIKGLKELSENISNGTQKCMSPGCTDKVTHVVLVDFSSVGGLFGQQGKKVAGCCDACNRYMTKIG